MMETKQKTPPSEPCVSDGYLTPDSQKQLSNRLARIEGHVGSVRRMVLEKRPADEILLQISAVKAAMNKVSAIVLENELGFCMNNCMNGTSDERFQKVARTLAGLLKQT